MSVTIPWWVPYALASAGAVLGFFTACLCFATAAREEAARPRPVPPDDLEALARQVSPDTMPMRHAGYFPDTSGVWLDSQRRAAEADLRRFAREYDPARTWNLPRP